LALVLLEVAHSIFVARPPLFVVGVSRAMSAFSVASIAAWALAVGVAALVRGRRAAVFASVLVGMYTLVAATLARYVGPVLPLFAYLHGAVYASFVFLARRRMSSLAYLLLVSWPASWFFASTFLAFPWALAAAVGFRPAGLFVPYLVGLLGFVDSFLPRRGTVQVALGGARRPGFGRAPRAHGHDSRPLRIVQITDPHLGPFMSVRRLRRICERAVAARPDLVLLTGDFLTMESQGDQALLGQALAPLADLPGRCFACFGNHDHEAPAQVREGLTSAGVKLLVDEMSRVETEAGPVEILGFDFRRRETKAHLEEVSARHPRRAVLRIGLLHDPGAFHHLPEATADLVLSGHTHGGQLGLLWLGLPHTIVSALSGIPDHGLWSRGKDFLYVHRGTGHYGFPLRLGVPPEESVLELHRGG
jgi:predicted MPP superfamily phosphohydrolase